MTCMSDMCGVSPSLVHNAHLLRPVGCPYIGKTHYVLVKTTFITTELKIKKKIVYETLVTLKVSYRCAFQ